MSANGPSTSSDGIYRTAADCHAVHAWYRREHAAWPDLITRPILRTRLGPTAAFHNAATSIATARVLAVERPRGDRVPAYGA